MKQKLINLEDATNEDFAKLNKSSSIVGESTPFVNKEKEDLILTSFLTLPNRQYKAVPTKVTLEDGTLSTAYIIYMRKKIIFNLYYKWQFRYYANTTKEANNYLYVKQLKYNNRGRKL